MMLFKLHAYQVPVTSLQLRCESLLALIAHHLEPEVGCGRLNPEWTLGGLMAEVVGQMMVEWCLINVHDAYWLMVNMNSWWLIWKQVRLCIRSHGSDRTLAVQIPSFHSRLKPLMIELPGNSAPPRAVFGWHLLSWITQALEVLWVELVVKSVHVDLLYFVVFFLLGENQSPHKNTCLIVPWIKHYGFLIN